MARAKLNARQRIFIRELVWSTPAITQGEAARRAGFKDKDASHAGYQLLRKPHVKAQYEKELTEKEELIKLQALGWLEDVVLLLRFDPKDLADENGNPLPVHKIPEHARRCLASVDIEELFEGRGEDREQVGVVRKYRVHDKKGVGELLLKWAGKLKDKVEHEVGDTLEALIDAALKQKE